MLTPTWTEIGSKEYLEEKIGNGFKIRIGWTEILNDTVLTVKLPYGFDYQVHCWNCVGVRSHLGYILGMPVHSEER